jgi:hypothetical protein
MAMDSDVEYRSEIERTVATLEAWSRDYSDVAVIFTSMQDSNWQITCEPHASGACPFTLLLRGDRRFDLKIAGESYDDKPIDRLDFFVMLIRAIAAGHVERVDVISALTGAVDAIETRVTLEDGWAWIGERRTGLRGARRTDTTQELRSHRFLAYRR